jgi:hypothetical protein
VEHGIFEHADLLGRGECAFQPRIVGCLRRGRLAEVGEGLEQDVEQGGGQLDLEPIPRQQLARPEQDDLLLRLLVGDDGICTKLNRRFRADDRSLTPRSRALAVAMMLKPGLAKTTLSPFSSGIVMYFSDRMEIRASCTSLLQRVSSSKRPISPCCIDVMIGDGMMLSRDWPAAITIATFQEYLM